MDYEKLHKKTLAALQQIVSEGKITEEIAKSICADFVKESEDERIRKWCVSHFMECVRVTKDNAEYQEYLNNKVIPWLEKQGEKKSLSITDEWIEDYWQHEKVNNPYSYDKGEEIQFDHQGFVRFCKKYCKGEQKPAWSEEDENGLGDALWAIQQARTIAKDENDMGNLWYAENWLKSLKERYTWKPSDEQIGVIAKIINSNTLDAYALGILQHLYQDLKKLMEE